MDSFEGSVKSIHLFQLMFLIFSLMLFRGQVVNIVHVIYLHYFHEASRNRFSIHFDFTS